MVAARVSNSTDALTGVYVAVFESRTVCADLCFTLFAVTCIWVVGAVGARARFGGGAPCCTNTFAIFPGPKMAVLAFEGFPGGGAGWILPDAFTFFEVPFKSVSTFQLAYALPTLI